MSSRFMMVSAFIALMGCGEHHGGAPSSQQAAGMGAPEPGGCTTLAEHCSFDDMKSATRDARTVSSPNENRAIMQWLAAAGREGYVYDARCRATAECTKVCYVELQGIEAAALAEVVRTKPTFEVTAGVVAAAQDWERSADCQRGHVCVDAGTQAAPDRVALTLRAGPMGPAAEHPEIFVELAGVKGLTCTAP